MSAEPDRVVAELDVFSCRSQLGDQTQLALFQYPLRTPWRPYEMDDDNKIRVKPVAKRVEMSVPLDTKGENYNDDMEEVKQIERLTLHSRPTNLVTSYALGYIRDGKVYLMPIDEAAQFRPHMAHLDEPVAKEPTQQETSAISEPELLALQVQVQRRETERQIHNKLNSHAYISKMEAEEEWVDVQLAGLHLADTFWDRLRQGPPNDVPMSLNRKDYLTSLLPGKGEDAQDPSSSMPTSTQEPSHRKSGSGRDVGKTSDPPMKVEASTEAVELSDLERSSLEAELGTMFRHGAVSSLAKIRKWMREAKKKPELARFLSMSDPELHASLTQLPILRNLGGSYIHLPAGDATACSFRQVVLDLLATKSGIRKAEIVEAAKKAGIDLSDTACMRAIKEICQSHGTSWKLKT